MKKFTRLFLLALLAGMSIAIGGTAFLALENKVLGTLFFSVGLFAICTMGFNLFTGKVCYVFDNDWRYALELIPIWVGNFLGTWLVAQAVRNTRVAAAYVTKAIGMCEIKLADGLLSIFLLSLLCNVLIYLAVESFKNNPHQVGKYMGILFGVMIFILCGFEHCVANMYYFSVAGILTGKAIGYLVVMSLGNAVGGIIFPLLRKLATKE